MNRHEWRGGARYRGGKVESAVGDAMDSRDWKAAGARERIEAASDRAIAATRRGSDTAAKTVRANDGRLLLAALAATGGYLAGWLIHRRA